MALHWQSLISMRIIEIRDQLNSKDNFQSLCWLTNNVKSCAREWSRTLSSTKKPMLAILRIWGSQTRTKAKTSCSKTGKINRRSEASKEDSRSVKIIRGELMLGGLPGIEDRLWKHTVASSTRYLRTRKSIAFYGQVAVLYISTETRQASRVRGHIHGRISNTLTNDLRWMCYQIE